MTCNAQTHWHAYRKQTDLVNHVLNASELRETDPEDMRREGGVEWTLQLSLLKLFSESSVSEVFMQREGTGTSIQAWMSNVNT